MRCSAKMDASEKEVGGDGHVVSPFDLSRALPVAGGLVPCSLPGLPVVK